MDKDKVIEVIKNIIDNTEFDRDDLGNISHHCQTIIISKYINKG